MKQSTRLALNTAATYVRMVLTAVITLVIVRLLFRAFGIENYGVYVALTASRTLLMVIQSALVAGSQRHLAYEIGRGTPERVLAVYNATLMVFALSALAVLLVGIALTGSILSVLTISAEQMTAARWTYFLSLLNLCGNIANTPLRAVLQARQSIVALSVIDLLDRVARLVAVFFLGFLPWSPMVSYMALNVLVTAMTFSSLHIYCRAMYAECRFAPGSLHRADFVGIGSFSVWVVFERLATGLREQGSVIALNSFFGPAVNAAYDVALRLGNQLAHLSGGLTNAIAPAMTAHEGGGNFAMVERLGNVGGRYSIYAASLPVVPVVLETDTFLRLWLVDVPEQATLFVQLVMIARFVGVLSWGDAMIAQAKGRIAVLSVALSLPFYLSFLAVIAWFALGGMQPMALPLMMLLTTAVLSVWYRPWYVRRMLGSNWAGYLREVLWRTMSAIVPATCVAAAVRLSMPESLVRMMAVIATYGLCLLAAVWFWGVERWERSILERLARDALSRARSLLLFSRT
jgi:O-antigen/teichoic acid export membrane protein